VITTHALFALKVQRTESNGVAGLAAGRASLDQEKSRPIRASQRCRSVANIGAERLLVDPGSIRPELHLLKPAAQTRTVSVAGIRLDPGNLCDLSKG
jgi:hypothetical protein